MSVVTQDEQPSWVRASQIKTAKASQRNATLASEALALVRGRGDIPDAWRTVAAVVAEGGRSWQQIGDTCGMTKFEAAGKFRRLLLAAGLK